MSDNWWQGGGESGGPSEADLRAAGFQLIRSGDSEYWQAPENWVRNPNSPMGYAPAPILPHKIGWRPTTELLQQLTTVAPQTVGRWTEGGEGGRIEYDVHDPASQAKMVLAQPEKVTPQFIAQNYPGFERLPAETLQAMANDWRNAYAQLMKISAPEKLPEGYAQAVSRIEDNKPFISFGGPTEIFQEATPYVTYDPNYGLIVPREGIQPERQKFSIMDLAPALALGAMFGPLAAGMGGGIAGAVGAGALTGALSSAMQGGPALKGALKGAVTAGLGQAVAPTIDSALKAADITGTAASTIKAATLAAGKAALTGEDPLQAALIAATGTSIGGIVSGLDVLKDLDPAVAKAITAAASGAARAAVSGGDPLQSAVSGAIGSTLGGLTTGTAAPGSTVPPVQYAQATPTDTMFDVPVLDVPEMTVDELIDEMLARQEPITELPSFEYATPTEQYIDTGGLAIPAQSGLYDVSGRAIPKDEYTSFTGPMFDEQGQMVVAAGEGLAPPQGEIEVAGTAPTYQDLLDQLMQQGEERAAMETAFSGYDPRLIEALERQEDERANMQTALTGYDQRLIDALEQQAAEKVAMQKALEDISASQEAQRGQIGGIQTGIGQLASNLLNRLGTTQQGLQKQITQTQQQAAQAQQQSDLSNLLMMLGMAQQQKKEQPPIPLVGEIKPFEFSTDLLEGIYAPRRRGLLGANEQLLNMTRG